MTARIDPVRLALQVGLYAFLGFLAETLLGWLLWPAGIFVAATISVFLAATLANSLAMRIYIHRGIAAIGLQSDKAALINLGLGSLGGAGAAAIVLAGPLLFHAARMERDPTSQASLPSFFFVSVLLLFGSAGEEILFRGFGFQLLVRALGGWTTILPVGVIFAVLHAANPNATWLGLANTAGFGVLFGYAFLRSHDIWLPIGLHFGWNFTLPLFGVNVSGLTMRLTAFTMQWSGGKLWSGGAYGPEASILTSGVLFLLFVYLWKAPIRRQAAALLDEPPPSAAGRPVDSSL